MAISQQEIYLTDDRSVIRVCDYVVLWESEELGLYGVDLKGINEGYVFGQCETYGGYGESWKEFKLRRSDGKKLSLISHDFFE